MHPRRVRRGARPRYVRVVCVVLPLSCLMLVAAGAVIGGDLSLVGSLHEPAGEHVDQRELLDLVRAGRHKEAFARAFTGGDELFETRFNALDGVGANVGQGQRFTRVPRADLAGPGEWATHVPRRVTGPNAQSCNACHSLPADDGAGSVAANAQRDPLHSGELRRFIQRNTPHLFAPGAVQRLAEEMTDELLASRAEAGRRARATGRPATVALSAKNIDFGAITATVRGAETVFDTSAVVGVGADLVVRPFQWKGSVASVRDFNRDASHNELGMQPVELVGGGVDGDHDGVSDEMTIGDQTALAVYLAAQPRPVTKLELSALRLIPRLTHDEARTIERGSRVFEEIGCADCHRPRLILELPIFSEPSQNEHYRDQRFPGGQDPVAEGVRPDFAVTFDLTRDQPDNRIQLGRRHEFRLGSLQRIGGGKAVVELYGDLKRHRMGARLAEGIDDEGVAADTYLTENLWGVGSTAPYLHDGRATTLTEAILEHGGEADAARIAFEHLRLDAQQALIAFLDNLVLFKLVEED